MIAMGSRSPSARYEEVGGRVPMGSQPRMIEMPFVTMDRSSLRLSTIFSMR
jgi:hypothetical protein